MLFRSMTQIIKNNTATVITITHDIATISQLGQKVLFIDSGNQIYYASYQGLMKSDNELIRQYFA